MGVGELELFNPRRSEEDAIKRGACSERTRPQGIQNDEGDATDSGQQNPLLSASYSFRALYHALCCANRGTTRKV